MQIFIYNNFNQIICQYTGHPAQNTHNKKLMDIVISIKEPYKCKEPKELSHSVGLVSFSMKT